MKFILATVAVFALGYLLQRRFDSRPMVMSREWSAAVLPDHIKEEKRRR